MAQNFIQPGRVMSYLVPSGGVVSGTPYLIGAILVVATVSVAAAGTNVRFAGEVGGCWTLPKATSQAWTEGATLYWDDTAKNVTTTASTNKVIGVAGEGGAASADTTGPVRLNGIGS